jgi:putative membrane protein
MSRYTGIEPVVLVALWYGIGLQRMWATVGAGRLVSQTRAALFACGLVATACALGPPLDSEIGTSLTAHMVQHMVLIWVSAPLLVAGAPLPTLLFALPRDAHLRVQRIWQRAHRSLVGPAWPLWVGSAVALQTASLIVWHTRPAYEAAVDNGVVHSLEHAAFLFTAMFLWWTIAGAVRRTRYGPGVLVVFIAKLPSIFIGVGMAVDVHVWYPVYGRGAAGLQDQQNAGLVMWLGAGAVATVCALVVLGLWLQALERAAPAAPCLPREVAPQEVVS